MNSHFLSLYRDYSNSLALSNASELFWSWISINHIQVHKEKENFVTHCLFTSFTKHETTHFHVVVLQWRQTNVQQSVMHEQSCSFVKLLLFLIPCGRRILNFLLFTIHCDQSETELTDMWNQTSHIRHLNSDVWQQTSDITRLISDTWRQTSEIRCLISDVWYQTPYIRRLTSDIWNQTSKNKSLKTDVSQQTYEIRHLKSDVWHQTSKIRRLISHVHAYAYSLCRYQYNTVCQISDAWCQVFKIRCLMSGSVIRRRTTDTWHQTSEIRHLTSDIWDDTPEFRLLQQIFNSRHLTSDV